MAAFSKAQLCVLRMAFAVAIVAGIASGVDAATASWDPNSEPDLAGYKLSYGTAPGVHTITIDVGNVITYQFFPPPGHRYYVVVQAYNTSGELSAKSTEAIVDIPLPNSPPALTQPLDQSTTLNSSASLALAASDPDGTVLSFSASGLPPGLVINNASGVIAGIASAKGTYQVLVAVSDGMLSASRTFTWTVVQPTDTPVIDPSMLDMAFDFGSDGVWLKYADTGWRKLDSKDPEEMASGDVDGNGQSDLIVDFPGQGLWIWLNDSAWIQLYPGNSGAVVTADLDGNGKSAVLIDFPGYGISVWRYGGEWYHVNWQSPRAMAAGDLNGDGREEVVMNFAGFGVWVWNESHTWSQIHGEDVTAMTVGDLDGNGRKDVLLDFPGAGIWVWRNNTSWWQLHTLGASLMTTGDLDGNGQDEAIIDFAGYGIWVWNGAGWSRLDARDAEALTAANLDADGRSDLMIDFGATGLWGWWNNANWTQVHTQSPEGGVAGNFRRR